MDELLFLSGALVSTGRAKQVFLPVLWIERGAWCLGLPVCKDHIFMKINVNAILPQNALGLHSAPGFCIACVLCCFYSVLLL